MVELRLAVALVAVVRAAFRVATLRVAVAQAGASDDGDDLANLHQHQSQWSSPAHKLAAPHKAVEVPHKAAEAEAGAARRPMAGPHKPVETTHKSAGAAHKLKQTCCYTHNRFQPHKRNQTANQTTKLA